MSSIYACPVHVDRQSADPHRLCPLCGQRPILLRAAAELGGEAPTAAAGERRETGAPEGAGAKPRQRARASASASAQPSQAAELAQDIDHAIELLSSIRDRLRALA